MLGSLIPVCAYLAVALFPVEAALELHPIETSVIELTNAERARYGLPPLTMDTSLMQSARKHAAWMTNNRNMVHTSARWRKTSPWVNARATRC